MVAISTAPTFAQTAPVNLPEEPLSQSLKAVANQTGTNILFTPEAVDGLRGRALQGSMSAREAVEQLISGSGLEVVPDGNGGLIVRKKDGAPRPQQRADAASTGTAAGETVIVTGTRIPGAQVASPVITVTNDQIKLQGFNDLGEVVRSLPQNYNGGQNPGVVPGAPQLANQNVTSGSSLDLRGLGPDATLTLLNGRRLAYDGFTQAVDISGIPVTAVDRLEVVLDGASAIYGSDAVGGVANLVLRRDYDGVSLTARYGAATDGGDEQAGLMGVAGTTWDGGGFLVTYSGEWNSGIDATQRDFTASLGPQNSLLPSIMHQSVLVSGHQDLTSNLELDLDGIYNYRNSHNSVNSGGFLDMAASNSETWLISPTLRMTLPGDWSLALNASAGQDLSHSVQTFVFLGIPLGSQGVCYCNTAQSVEFDAEGPVFDLPGGPAQLSVGAGYRNTSFKSGSGLLGIGGSRHVLYGFAEANFPFISPDQDIPFVNRLDLNVAARVEGYSDFGSVVTPKVGLVWGVTPDFDLKGTWGQSFKAPTLLQEYEPATADIAPVALFGGSGPPGATGLLLQGGSKDLDPERATTYTGGVSFHPDWIPRLDLGLSYFSVAYTNRVLTPINNPGLAGIDPAAADFVTVNPSAALVASVMGSVAFVHNQTAVTPPDLSTIVLLADDRYVNATRQHISGVDLTVSYAMDLFGGTLAGTGNLAWLQGNQLTTPTSSLMQISGVLYYPPKLRVRGGLSWARDGLTVSAYSNYVGAVQNNTVTPVEDGDGMTTVDAIIDYKTDHFGPVDNVEFNLSVMNLFDQKPPFFTNINPGIVSYDSTNYSAIGRFVSFSITKSW